MVIIRLARGGAHKRPYFHMVETDSRSRRDGNFIERVGFFNPVAAGNEEKLRISMDRVEYWRSNGAQVSPRVARLIKEFSAQKAA
jgi:small subunit ribosomal protein S16